MTFVFSMIAALSLASIPIILGWRRTADEAAMAKQLGIGTPRKKFDPDRFALQTGTGLAFNQLLFGFLAWVFGGLIAGLFLGVIAAIIFATAGGLLYYGSLAERRQEFRMRQAKDILRGLGVVETLLAQGKTLQDSFSEAADAVGADGRMVLGDLVARLRAAPASAQGSAIRDWTNAWDNPAVDMVATCLLASVEGAYQHRRAGGKIKNYPVRCGADPRSSSRCSKRHCLAGQFLGDISSGRIGRHVDRYPRGGPNVCSSTLVSPACNSRF